MKSTPSLSLSYRYLVAMVQQTWQTVPKESSRTGGLWVSENMCILGNQHAKVTLSSKYAGSEASSFDSESKHLISLAMCGLVLPWLALSMKAHTAGLRGRSATAEGSEYPKGRESSSNQVFQIRKKRQNGLLPPKGKKCSFRCGHTA